MAGDDAGRGAGGDDTTGDAQGDQQRREAEVVAASAPLGQRLQRVALLVVLVVFAIFAVANAQPVEFNWIFGEAGVDVIDGERVGGVPLIILLVVSFVLGAVVAWLASWRSRRKKLKELRGQG